MTVSHGKEIDRVTVLMVLIAPSLLAADFSRLGEALRLIGEAGASMVHVDVMDGHFTPDISVGQPVVGRIRKATNLVLDLHLLIERPERFVSEFIEIGADRIAVHVEATLHLSRVLGLLRARGIKAGVAVNPSTPVEAVSEVLCDIDFLTILAAEPQVGGYPQDRGSRTISKLRQAARLREEGGYQFALQVEGGVGLENIEELVRAGADILVADSDIFQKDLKISLAMMLSRAASLTQISRN